MIPTRFKETERLGNRRLAAVGCNLGLKGDQAGKRRVAGRQGVLECYLRMNFPERLLPFDQYAAQGKTIAANCAADALRRRV